MSIWEYAQGSHNLIARFCAVRHCPFCNTCLMWTDDPDLAFAPMPGLAQMSIGVCRSCGWWNGQGEVRERSNQFADAVYDVGSYGALKCLDLRDIGTPLQEVRDYLTAKYDARYTIDPRLFEHTVGSVFSDHGYATEVTAYSGDGGIDVILTDGSNRIGVQVKRSKNKIEATQIHALEGALVLAGMTRGIFVTTSAFRSGAARDAERFGALGVPIELLDAPRFLDALKIAQTKVERSVEEWAVEIGPHLRKLGWRTEIDEEPFYSD